MKAVQEVNDLINVLYKKHNYKRRDLAVLSEKKVSKDPLIQFCLWFKEAVGKVAKPYEMALATATAKAKPSVRMVLLKSINEDGFTFFSNYKSRKGKELEENNNAAMLFYWPETNRQIRIEGTVTKIPSKQSDLYFKSRAKESQISALISAQSNIISQRQELEIKWGSLHDKSKGEIPRPLQWGGYRLKPTSFEFWQHRPHRLHDRIFYALEKGVWKINRLAP